MIGKPNPLIRYAGALLLGVLAAMVAGGWCAHFSMLLSVVFVVTSIVLFVLLILGIMYEVMTRLQWRILELLSTLVVGTLPFAVFAPHAPNAMHNLHAEDWVCLGLYGFAGMACAFTGSVLGSIWISRLKEQRTQHRLGLLLLGWLAMTMIYTVPVGVFFMIQFLTGRTSVWRTEDVAIGASCVISFLVLSVLLKVVESRAKATELAAQQNPGNSSWTHSSTNL